MEIGVLGFFRYGTLIGLQGLWLGPYLMDIVWNILDTQVLDPDSGEPLGHSVIEKDIQVWTYYLEKHDLELKDWLLGIRRAAKTRGSRLVMRILSPSWFTRRKYGHVLCHLTLLKRVSSLPEYPRA
jgi:hypothetical protein